MDKGIVGSLAQIVSTTIVSALPQGKPVALLDYPNHMNAGDQAIWLGEKRILAEAGFPVVYECSLESYDEAELRRAIGDGTILLHGGGNFGDVWPRHHEFRERIILAFPDNPIVLLPQTVMIHSNNWLFKTRHNISRHKNLTLFGRDLISHHILRTHFPNQRVLLAPDSAFSLGPLPRVSAPAFDIVWLSRTDLEAQRDRSQTSRALVGDAAQQNFLIPVPEGWPPAVLQATVGDGLMLADWLDIKFQPENIGSFLKLGFDDKSNFNVWCARWILSLGRVVVTDRLHAHILCTMMDIPHVFLNNTYGKNWNFYESWTRATPTCTLASTPEAALGAAREILASAHERARRLSTIANQESDVERWSKAESFDAVWNVRAAMAAKLVDPNATVLDLGCGTMALEGFLSPGSTYIPCDLVSRDGRTVVCDLNKGEVPPTEGVSTITALGVFEYLFDLKSTLTWLRSLRVPIVFSYCSRLPQEQISVRTNAGWVNHFTREEIGSLVQSVGFRVVHQSFLPPNIDLFRME